MGNAPSFSGTYARPLPGTCSVSDSAVFRCSEDAELVQCHPERQTKTCWDDFAYSTKQCPQNPYLGKRVKDASGELGDFQWMTYKEVYTKALLLGTKMQRLDFCPVIKYTDEDYEPAQAMRSIGVFCKNRPEWFILEQACNAFNVVLIPLYDTLGEDAIKFIFKQTQMRSLLCGSETLEAALNGARESPSMKNIIVLDQIPAKMKEVAEELGVALYSYNELMAKEEPLATPTPATNGDAVWTLCYTSGTTDNPKGVLLTHTNILSCVASCLTGALLDDSVNLGSSDSHLSYLPLAHVFERTICCCVISFCGRLGCYSGDVLKLLDDIKVMQPTVFVSVPRLFNRINDKVSASIKDKSTIAQTLFKRGLDSKVTNHRTSAKVSNMFWDTLVFGKTKRLMGSKLRFMISGGAPLNPAVHERMMAFFCAPVLQGYGMTETIGPAFLANVNDPVIGHVGGIYSSLEFKIRSVGEMDYLVTDDPPKGELLLRGNSIARGYFRNREETKKAWDEDGWLSTGDIVALMPSNAIAIIDRKKNIFKLSQGEYVAAEKVENVYLNALPVSQAFVYGDSMRSRLVGIVVPDPGIAAQWASNHNLSDSTYEDICKQESFKKYVVEEMVQAAADANLKGFEKVADVHLSSVMMSVENGTMTPTMKIKRHQAKTMFQEQIDAMYLSLGE